MLWSLTSVRTTCIYFASRFHLNTFNARSGWKRQVNCSKYRFNCVIHACFFKPPINGAKPRSNKGSGSCRPREPQGRDERKGERRRNSAPKWGDNANVISKTIQNVSNDHWDAFKMVQKRCPRISKSSLDKYRTLGRISNAPYSILRTS